MALSDDIDVVVAILKELCRMLNSWMMVMKRKKILLNAIIAKTVDDEVFCDVARACLHEGRRWERKIF